MSSPVVDAEAQPYHDWCNGVPRLQAKAGTLRVHLDKVKPKNPLIEEGEWEELLDENDEVLERLEAKAGEKKESKARSKLRQRAAREVVEERVAEIEEEEGLDLSEPEVPEEPEAPEEPGAPAASKPKTSTKKSTSKKPSE
tara:strand:+ start:7415 stop:7837 length:423 start_codon:yes stop_codon:yes gene_type:complete